MPKDTGVGRPDNGLDRGMPEDTGVGRLDPEMPEAGAGVTCGPAAKAELPWSEQAEAWEVYLQALASFLSAGLSMLEFEQLSTAEKIAAIPDNYIAAVLGSKYWPQGAFYRQKSLRARGLPLCCLHSTNQNDPILEAAGSDHAVGCTHHCLRLCMIFLSTDHTFFDTWLGSRADESCFNLLMAGSQQALRYNRRVWAHWKQVLGEAWTQSDRLSLPHEVRHEICDEAGRCYMEAALEDIRSFLQKADLLVILGDGAAAPRCA
ncbi:unnamed protein product [Symbiodinium microadriaticum]|nr:unnamed protein product [Symbiodinium microadriaticum]